MSREMCLNCLFEPAWKVAFGSRGEKGQCLFSSHSLQAKLPTTATIENPFLYREGDSVFVIERWTQKRKPFPPTCPAFRAKRDGTKTRG